MRIKLEAHAFIIHRYCERHGWDVTREELADGTGLTLGEVRYALHMKPRLRKKLGGQSVSSARQVAGRKGGAVFSKRHGHDFDEYALDLVDLFA